MVAFDIARVVDDYRLQSERPCGFDGMTAWTDRQGSRRIAELKRTERQLTEKLHSRKNWRTMLFAVVKLARKA